jgi:hypothetical protein
MQPAISIEEEWAISPVWLRPGAVALVAGVHLLLFAGIPGPPATDRKVPRPYRIEVIQPPAPARPATLPDASAQAVEVKPASAAKIDAHAVEAQALAPGRDTAEVKPAAPAFASNVPPPAVSPAQHPAELKEFDAPRPMARAEVARPAREAPAAKEPPLRVAKASEASRPSPQRPAEAKPLDVSRTASASEAERRVPEAQPGREPLPLENPAQGQLPSSERPAEAKPLDVSRPASAFETARPAPETQPGKQPLPIENPAQGQLPASARPPEAKPLDVGQPASAFESAQPAPETQPGRQALSVENTAQGQLPSSERPPEAKPLDLSPPASAFETAQPAPQAQPGRQPLPLESPAQGQLPPVGHPPETKPLDVSRPATLAEAARPAPSLPQSREPASPLDGPAQNPAPALGARVVEQTPNGAGRPAASAQAAQPAREARGNAVAQSMDRPGQAPRLSPDQRVAALAPLAPGKESSPVGSGGAAREIAIPGSNATPGKPSDQGSLLSSGQQAELRPYSAVTGPLLRDQGPLRPERIEKIVRYVLQYDGGNCFFVAPVEVNELSATLQGYGASRQPFETLDRAFQHQNGFEATIDVRLVLPAQCPAVDFLGRLRGAVGAPNLRVESDRLSVDDSLTGVVDRDGGSNIALLLVTDSGAVLNVSYLLKPDPADKTFTMTRADIRNAAAGQPQLLIAVATLKPFEALRFDRPVAADRLFPALLSEAVRTSQGIAATARYFKLER